MEEKGASAKSVQCPICSKEFVPAVIEAHVSKCLFLNESSNEQRRGSQTMSKSSSDSSTSNSKSPLAAKRQKFGGKSSSATTIGRPIVENRDKTRPDEIVNNREKNGKNEARKVSEHVPLAERMRPTSILEYIGQTHIMGKNGMLLQLLEKGEVPNIILWGPPGCGKTSLANVIANICKQSPGNKLRYVKLSAAMSGVADVKESVTIATNELKFGRRTIMFMDEIHRFNKSQQDIFLPHIESGTITLVGATTENPSFSLNSALLSRSRVIVLEKLSTKDLVGILGRAVRSLRGKINSVSSFQEKDDSRFGLGDDSLSSIPRFIVDSRTIEWLGETCDGDARIALGGLELAVQSIVPPIDRDDEFLTKAPASISLEDIETSLKKSHMLYDRKGDQHYDIISALHKSVRASDENASLYWLTRMMAGGEDPVYIARRLVRMACEDVGLADPKALGIAVHTMQACKMIGMPECDVLLAQCVTYLSRAPKSRLMEDSLRAAQRLVADHRGPQPGVPLHLRNAPTRLVRNLGYGRGYNMMHKDESGLNYLPEGLENVDFFGEFDYADTD